VPRRPTAPTSMMPQTEDAVFYQLYFQTPGVAEAELEHDVRRSIRSLGQDVQLKLGPGSDSSGLRLIAFVQEPRQGRVLGAASMLVNTR
jgi:hypothetical protein